MNEIYPKNTKIHAKYCNFDSKYRQMPENYVKILQITILTPKNSHNVMKMSWKTVQL